MTITAVVMTLALTAWSPAFKAEQMEGCMRARTSVPSIAATAKKVCKCAVNALEKACPNEATVDKCATAEVMLPILRECKKK